MTGPFTFGAYFRAILKTYESSPLTPPCVLRVLRAILDLEDEGRARLDQLDRLEPALDSLSYYDSILTQTTVRVLRRQQERVEVADAKAVLDHLIDRLDLRKVVESELLTDQFKRGSQAARAEVNRIREARQRLGERLKVRRGR